MGFPRYFVFIYRVRAKIQRDGVKVLARRADSKGGVSLLRRIRAILDKAPPEQDPRDVVIEQQDREIGRLRDELARHKDVHRENGRVQRQNDGLQRRIERLERENEHLNSSWRPSAGRDAGKPHLSPRSGRRVAAVVPADGPVRAMASRDAERARRTSARPLRRRSRQRNLDLPALVATMLRAPEPIVPDVFGLPPPSASSAAPKRAH